MEAASKQAIELCVCLCHAEAAKRPSTVCFPRPVADLLVYSLVPLTPAFITSPVHTHSRCVRRVTSTRLGLPCAVYDIPSGSGRPSSLRRGLNAEVCPRRPLVGDVCRACRVTRVRGVCVYLHATYHNWLVSLLASLRCSPCLNCNQKKKKKKMGKREIRAAFLLSACPRDAAGPRHRRSNNKHSLPGPRCQKQDVCCVP